MASVEDLAKALAGVKQGSGLVGKLSTVACFAFAALGVGLYSMPSEGWKAVAMLLGMAMVSGVFLLFVSWVLKYAKENPLHASLWLDVRCGAMVSVPEGLTPMIALLRRYFARRRLRPVVSVLPRRLAKAFGTGQHCTFLQARRVISELDLREGVEPYAFAAACQLQELEMANFPLSAHDYQRLRSELADLFGLRGPDFTIRDLVATPYSTYTPGSDSMAGLNVPPSSSSGDASGAG